MKEHEQICTSQREGINKMACITHKDFKYNKYDDVLVFSDGTTEKSFELILPKGFNFGNNENKVLSILIDKFMEKLDTNNLTESNIRKAAHIIITNDEIMELFGGSNKKELKRVVKKACENLEYIKFYSNDIGRENHKMKFNRFGILHASNTNTKNVVDVEFDPCFAEYIAYGHITYLPKNLYKINNFEMCKKYGFTIARILLVHQRMNANKSWNGKKGKQYGAYNLDKIIDKIPQLKKRAKKSKSEAYEYINATLLAMEELGIIKNFHYQNNKIAESGIDYNNNFKLLEGDKVEYEMCKELADTYKTRRKTTK